LRRSEALRSLSQEHHQALSIGRDLSRANDAGAAAESFLEFWKRDGALHFRLEEEVLLPYWAVLGIVHAEAAARLAREHLQLRSAALRVAQGTPSLALVRQLGGQLAAHVRFEERELFPLIEASLGPAGLERLARAVADAEEELHA
jgi:hemerythrin-like domain-containing protein